MKDYTKEKELIIKSLKKAFDMFSGKVSNVESKSKFDLVTSFDKSVEEFITCEIKN